MTDSDHRSPGRLRGLFRNALGVGYLHMQAGMFVMAGAGFAMTWALARILTAAELGQINIVRVGLMFVLIPAIWGMDLVASRYAALEGDSRERQREVLAWCLRVTLVASSLTALVLFLGLTFLPLIRDKDAREMARWLVLALPLMAGIDMLLGFLQGRKRLAAYSWARAGRQVLLLLLMVTIVWWRGKFGWAWARVLADAIGLGLLVGLVGVSWFRAALPPRPFRREMLAYGGWSMMISLFLSVLFFADFACLDHFVGKNAQIGHYAIARLLLDGLLLIPRAMTKAVFPYTAQHGRSPQRLWNHFRYAAVRIMSANILIALVAYAMSGLIPFVFGSEYESSILYFQILLVGFVAQAFGMLCAQTVMAAGLARSNTVAALLIGGSNVALLVLFVGVFRWAAVGAAWATALTHIIGLVLCLGILLVYRARKAGIS
ncbi:MAG: oligosaccharide flippase family protein [Candidatus Sumerlaeia bacterium]